jgi:hypothetical protein
METGFGSPSLDSINSDATSTITTTFTVFDWGFGSPTGGIFAISYTGLTETSWPDSTAYSDTACGSPFMVFEEPPYISANIGGFPQEGGSVAKLFTNLDAGLGAYYIRFYQTVSGAKQYYPSAAHEAYSAIPGEGTALYPRNASTHLRFVIPPLPLGVYSLEILHGPNKIFVFNVANAFRTVPNPRDSETYATRNRFSSVFKVGNRNRIVDEIQFNGTEEV